jgi:hypothetical protein
VTRDRNKQVDCIVFNISKPIRYARSEERHRQLRRLQGLINLLSEDNPGAGAD